MTLSSLPHHKHTIDPTLQSLLAQSVKADAIYLALPERSSRTQELYGVFDVPEGITILHAAQDYGPLTKLLPALLAENDPDTIVITLDDDKLYHEDVVKYLVWHAEHKYDASDGNIQ